ncbi:MAG: ribbon-helix-helix protein, CopG family [Chloroflexi bacterium]|nr:MAG: ribbon-helix-helix protein, CopG family [Chloroflexota bacterium]
MASLRRRPKPLQIYLQPDQDRVLRAVAEREHVSLAELIRRSIDCYLTDILPPETDPSLGLIGLQRPDLSISHDELVASEAAAPADGE